MSAPIHVLVTRTRSLVFLFIVLLMVAHSASTFAKPSWKTNDTQTKPGNGDETDSGSTGNGNGNGKGKKDQQSTFSDVLISEELVSKTVTEGDSVIFSVSASSTDGATLNYQWFRDGVMLSGVDTSSFSIASASLTDAGTYAVEVSTTDTTKSSTASLQVDASTPDTFSDVLISEELVSRTVTEGDSVVFSVSASSSDGSTLSYQWFRDGAMLSGVETSSYTISSAALSDAGTYVVEVSTSDATKASSASLQVEAQAPAEPDIAISYQPGSQNIYVGDSFTLNVTADGSETLAYQWRKDGILIGGATQSYFSVSSAELSDAGSYDVVVSNATGSVSSDVAMVSVETLPTISLSWNTPTLREDGSELSAEEIDSYNIYISYENDVAEEVINVSGDINAIDLDEMLSGTYYFAIATIDTMGQAGQKSEIISISVN